MAYPTSPTTFTTKQDDVDDVEAAHINDLQTLLSAIETALLQGIAHHLIPSTDNARDLGTAAARFRNLYLSTLLRVAGSIDLTGGKIAFPAAQSASADANTLDDYEEGTWTPVFTGSGGESGQVYALQVGRYVKVGQLVTATFDIALSTLGTFTGQIQLGTLPFAAKNVANLFAVCSLQFQLLSTNWITLHALTQPGSTTMLLRGLQAAATTNGSTLAQADFSATTQLYGTVVYQADA